MKEHLSKQVARLGDLVLIAGAPQRRLALRPVLRRGLAPKQADRRVRLAKLETPLAIAKVAGAAIGPFALLQEVRIGREDSLRDQVIAEGLSCLCVIKLTRSAQSGAPAVLKAGFEKELASGKERLGVLGACWDRDENAGERGDENSVLRLDPGQTGDRHH
ncbi:MAG: hypothetical protein GC187_04215 [Alphaproteobacteria bacterium]|nr:hypothetical protein [Alphaproteobacteria bacterium]